MPSASSPLPSAPETIALASEAAVSWSDIAIVAVVIALAVAYLWKTYFSRRRTGCAGCGKARSCPVAEQASQGRG